MPLIMRCDAPGCVNEIPASVTPAGRVFGTGWWYVRGDGKGVCACCDEHFAQALALPEPQKAA